MNREQDLPALHPFHGIKFHDRKIRELRPESKEILVGAAKTAGFIHFEGNGLAFSGAEPDFPGHVDVARGKEVVVHVGVEGLFAEHNGIGMVLADGMEGLALTEQRRDDRIEPVKLLLRDRKASPGFGACKFIFPLCGECIVEPFFQGTGVAVRAAIADIGRLREFPAGFLMVKDTGRSAASAELTGAAGTVGTGFAKTINVAGEAVGAVIERLAESPRFFKDEMVSDFFGNGGTVLIQFKSDGLEGEGGIEGMFDDIPAFEI